LVLRLLFDKYTFISYTSTRQRLAFGDHDDLLDAAATGTVYLLDRPELRVLSTYSGKSI